MKKCVPWDHGNIGGSWLGKVRTFLQGMKQNGGRQECRARIAESVSLAEADSQEQGLVSESV